VAMGFGRGRGGRVSKNPSVPRPGTAGGGGNICVNPLNPCRTITHTLTQVNPALRTTIWLIGNGSSFNDGTGGETFPLGIPPNVTLRWSGLYSSTEATISYQVGSPLIQSAILFDATAGPAGGGIDGTVPASGANGIKIVGSANHGLVNIRAAGTNTAAPTIKRVTFENGFRAIQIEENFTPPATGGGTLSPRIDTCAFTGPGSSTPDSGHIWMEALPPGVGAPSSTITPGITNCTFGVSNGSAGFLGAIVMFVARTPSALPPWTAVVAPSISTCIIDGRYPLTMMGEHFDFGILAKGSGLSNFALTGAANFSPSVSGSVVRNCDVTGIRFWAQDLGMVGTPVLSGTTVRDCGLNQTCVGFPPASGSDEGDGNGAAITTGDFSTLTPAISDCVFEHNGCDGLGLYIRGGGLAMIDQEPEFSAAIVGSVVRCVSRNNGDDGFELRARGFSQAQPNPLISTVFNANRSHDNGDTGIEILTIGDGGAGGPTTPSITSTHTNELYYDNVAEGMRIQAYLPLGGSGTLAPIAEWMTCWSNGPTGISYTPATPGGGTATGTPALWNSIVGAHTMIDIDLNLPATSVNFCNFPMGSGPTGTFGHTFITPDFEAGVGNFHLAATPANNYCAVIDYGAENPGCPNPPCVPVAVAFDFDGPTNPRVLDNPAAICSTPLADRGVDERP